MITVFTDVPSISYKQVPRECQYCHTLVQVPQHCQFFSCGCSCTKYTIHPFCFGGRILYIQLSQVLQLKGTLSDYGRGEGSYYGRKTSGTRYMFRYLYHTYGHDPYRVHHPCSVEASVRTTVVGRFPSNVEVRDPTLPASIRSTLIEQPNKLSCLSLSYI